jgi:hypothetical protein
VQYGREPSTPSSCPTARLREQTSVSRLGLLSSTSLVAGSSNTSTMLSGPRFDAEVAVGS